MSAIRTQTQPEILSRHAILASFAKDNPGKSHSAYMKKLQQKLKDGSLVHVGRDAYQPAEQSSRYEHTYSRAALRQDDAVIVEPLLTESPRSSQGPWQTGLEKLLVDLLTDKYLRSSISESEYPLIYETAFERYTVDERKLFRYARRRNAAQKIRQLIKDKTSIELRTETTC